MEFKPSLQVVRLEQVASGDLFIFDGRGGKCAAIKVIDPANGGQKMTLALGPFFQKMQMSQSLSMNNECRLYLSAAISF